MNFHLRPYNQYILNIVTNIYLGLDFSRITLQNVKYNDSQYISDVIFFRCSSQTDNKAVNQFFKIIDKYYNGNLLTINDDSYIEYFTKVNRFKTKEYFLFTMKSSYLSTLLKKSKPIEPDKPHSSKPHTSKKKSYPYQKSYDILFKINIPKSIHNIKYIFDNDLIALSTEQEHILRHILSSKKNHQFNKNDLFNIIQIINIPSSQIIVYNFECPEYKDLLDNFEYHFKNKTNTLNYQRYISIHKSRYTISEILGFLPLLSQQDLLEVIQSYNIKDAFFANSIHIIDTIVSLAKKSHYYQAKKFYFEVVRYVHENKVNRFKSEDPMAIVSQRNPSLKPGKDAYLNLAYNFQTLANCQFPKEITDSIKKFYMEVMR